MTTITASPEKFDVFKNRSTHCKLSWATFNPLLANRVSLDLRALKDLQALLDQQDQKEYKVHRALLEKKVIRVTQVRRA